MAFVAIETEIENSDLLSAEALSLWRAIKKHCADRYPSEDEKGQRRLRQVIGCLDKLGASLQQIDRIRHHEKNLLAHDRLGGSLVLRAAPMIADFEGLLLQGRAALDRLTYLLAASLKSSCSSYRKLGNVLEHARDSPFAPAVLAVHRQTTPWLNELFGKFQSEESLRDLAGHKNALTELVEVSLGKYWSDNDEFVLLDCEVKLPRIGRLVPLLATSGDSVKYLSFAVLGSIAPLFDLPAPEHSGFTSPWRTTSRQLSLYIAEQVDGAPLGEHHLHYVRYMTAGSIQWCASTVDPALFGQRAD